MCLCAGSSCGSSPPRLANGDAEATLELVLAVVEGSPQGQCEREGQKLLFEGRPNHPVTVNCACGEKSPSFLTFFK